jgi:uncharacterized protein YbjQ (UPF0145 family)
MPGTPVPAGQMGAVLPIDAALAHLHDRWSAPRGHLASSDLSVDEAILVSEAGYTPRGLVMGSSIYHVGYQWTSGLGNVELSQLSHAMYDARHHAMSRLTEECERVGGVGVVGVRLTVRMFESRRNLMEFVAIGTAIAGEGRTGRRRTRGRPFTSDLSGQDFYLLCRAGYEPVEMVMGSCVYHVAYRSLGNVLRQKTQNVELENLTQAFYQARELAMERMQEEAQSVGAEGVVGVQVSEQARAWGSRAVEFFAIGTAVRLAEEEHRLVEPMAAVPLDDAVVATDPGAIVGRGRAGEGNEGQGE